MSRRVPRRRDDADASGDIVVAVDLREFDARRERPLRHRVLRSVRCFELGSLHDDGRVGEAMVLPTVVEVQVRRDDRRDVHDAHAVAVKGLAEIVVHRVVKLIDERVAHTPVSMRIGPSG